MSSIHRRAAVVGLNWPPAMGEQEYRVIVRNEDTGDRRIVHQGTETSCRLPPDFRITADQLSFRVDSRPLDDAFASFRRFRHYTAIPRTGDDFATPAADLLSAPPVSGVQAYRLAVRDAKTEKSLVDFARDEPAFLLPAGRLGQRETEWRILHRVDFRWIAGEWDPVTPAMIAAAGERAQRLIDLPRPQQPASQPNDAPYRPGRAQSLAETAAPPFGARLLIVADVTAQPLIASAPTSAAIIGEQWSDSDGGGAVERVARMIEANGLSGVFFLDVFAGSALGSEAMADLARTLTTRGHSVELLINPEPWGPLLKRLLPSKLSSADLAKQAAKLFEKTTGGRPKAVRLAPGLATIDMMKACAAAGVGAVIVDPVDQQGLPRWMRTAVNPFAAFDDLVVFPISTLLSTPAHVRDRVVRHVVGAADALVASTADRIAQTMADTPSPNRLLTVRLDPMMLLERKRIRSASAAESWNDALKRSFPAAATMWRRQTDVFERTSGDNDIAVDTMASLLAGLGRSGVGPLETDVSFDPAGLRAWVQPTTGYEPVLEQRRGSHGMRRSAIRRYDDAYRQALLAPSP